MTIEIKNKMKLRRKPLSCSFVSQHYLITGTETHLGAVKGGKGGGWDGSTWANNSRGTSCGRFKMDIKERLGWIVILGKRVQLGAVQE